MTVLQALEVHQLALCQIRTRTKFYVQGFSTSSTLSSQEPNNWTLNLSIWEFLQVMRPRCSSQKNHTSYGPAHVLPVLLLGTCPTTFQSLLSDLGHRITKFPCASLLKHSQQNKSRSVH